MNEFLREIYSQPKALRDTWNHIQEQYKEKFTELRTVLEEKNISRIIFTGMGSSYFSSYPSYYYLIKKGISAEIREAGEFLFYGIPEKDKHSLERSVIVLISQSGESGEIVRLLNKLKSLAPAPLIIGISNDSSSTLNRKSDYAFIIKAGTETSVTSKSYTSTLLFLFVFTTILSGQNFSSLNTSDIDDLILEIDKFLENMKTFDNLYDRLLSFFGVNFDFLEILGRGPSLATVYQGALNFKEIAKTYSEGNPCSTFNHGSIECLKKNTHIIILSSDKTNYKLNLNLIEKIVFKWKCGKILHVANQDYQPNFSSHHIHDNPKIYLFQHRIKNPYLSPIMEIIVLQLLFFKIAEENNINPGEFYFTKKITKEI
ncbi:MAG: SIS domain-containing protein [Candidatus Lokiarchaeota archaeon]|nr:SIS domain-containing protein [Candidatus Lokiarchaeota archaeon]MBD3342033.1 SIS domain-containing protein [Candidatus Lokiarchaeota archaeon]